MRAFTLIAVFVSVSFAATPDYNAGIARADITPDGPIWLSGYASRTKPSEGVFQKIWAKALAIEDRSGNRVVVVTTDLLGLPRSITDAVGARVEKEYGLSRSALLVNSSHTHTGPLIRSVLKMMADLDSKQEKTVDQYTARLTDQLVALVGTALGALKPAVISYGTGTVGFSVNRREFTQTGVKIGINRGGPVDHTVPVLRVNSPEGNVVAVLFGYACHNTTLTGEHYKISGDYAGVAQAELEHSLGNATAMFLQLCAGDQNPDPRST